jgi:hypothetical protein
LPVLKCPEAEKVSADKSIVKQNKEDGDTKEVKVAKYL